MDKNQREKFCKWLNDRKKGTNCRKLLEYCREAQAFDTYQWVGDLKIRSDVIFNILRDLKEVEAMEFKGDRKWQTTKEAIEVLDANSSN